MTLPFADVLTKIYKGGKFCRSGWNGKGIFIEAQIPDSGSKMQAPYLYIDSMDVESINPDAVRTRVPWLPSQTDMAATDWLKVADDERIFEGLSDRDRTFVQMVLEGNSTDYIQTVMEMSDEELESMVISISVIRALAKGVLNK